MCVYNRKDEMSLRDEDSEIAKCLSERQKIPLFVYVHIRSLLYLHRSSRVLQRSAARNHSEKQINTTWCLYLTTHTPAGRANFPICI